LSNGSAVETGIGLALQQALDAMNDIYVVYDSSWRFVFQNRAQREIMLEAGLDPDDAMGKVVWDVIPSLEGTAAASALRHAMTARVVTEWEETYPEDFRIQGRAFPTPGGGIAVVARDISNQWKAEARHRAAEERTAALQATTAALASALTLDRVTDIIVSEGRSTVGALAGSVALLKEDGLLHIIAAAGYNPEIVQRFEHFSIDDDLPFSHAVKTGKAIILNSIDERDTLYRHLKEARRMSGGGAIAAIPMTIDGEVVGGLGFTFPVDLTVEPEAIEFMTALAQQCAQAIERARLYEAEKKARAFAEEANKAKSDFLTTMSHELRTPLNAIGGYADLIQAGIRGPVTEEQLLDLNRIKRSQRHLLSLINDVLNFAKLQAGMVQVADVEVDIDAVASGAEALVTPQILERSLTYRFLSSGERSTGRGDPEKVEQILLNLLSNAIKFTEPGGEITVSVESDASSVIVKVSDTGTGISSDKLQAVFEPFVQLNRTKTSANAGTGLGLAISRDLARAMGGELSVKSEANTGSTFTLKLPRAVRSED
jgi:signal transduction histidine kinase